MLSYPPLDIFLAPSASPDRIVVSNTTANSFLLSWNSPPRSSQNGVIRNYTIILTEEDTGREIETATQRTSELFETLHPFYNYTFQVAAVTVAVGPFSQIRKITTLEDGEYTIKLFCFKIIRCLH